MWTDLQWSQDDLHPSGAFGHHFFSTPLCSITQTSQTGQKWKGQTMSASCIVLESVKVTPERLKWDWTLETNTKKKKWLTSRTKGLKCLEDSFQLNASNFKMKDSYSKTFTAMFPVATTQCSEAPITADKEGKWLHSLVRTPLIHCFFT